MTRLSITGNIRGFTVPLLKGIKRQSHYYEASSRGRATNTAVVPDLLSETVSRETHTEDSRRMWLCIVD